jgi:hypothetical protein
MRIKYFLILCFLSIFLTGCTTPGSKVIKVQYIGQAEASIKKNIGIAPFIDKRQDLEQGYIGKRILNSGSNEIYVVKGLNIASTTTNAFEAHFKKNGFNCQKINSWPYKIEWLKKVDKKYNYILSGDIIEFEFFANKGFTTSMVLDIKLIIYLGNIEKNELITIPVNLNLKRKDIKFSVEKVENFINESLTEVIIRAMAQENLQ